MAEKPKFNRRDFVRQGLKGLVGVVGQPIKNIPDGPEPPSIMAGMAEFPAADTSIPAYIARPEQNGSYPAIIIVHEYTGLDHHIKDIARRFANEGFVAIAPDLFSREEHLPQTDIQAAQRYVQTIPDGRILGDLEATIDHLKVLTFVNDTRIGAVGYSMGGLYAYLLATHTDQLRAAVNFYGPISQNAASPIEAAPDVKCPILGIFGESDHLVPLKDVGAFRDALMQHRKPFQIKVYPEAPHGFFNNTSDTFRADMAKDAWERMLRFLGKYL